MQTSRFTKLFGVLLVVSMLVLAGLAAEAQVSNLRESPRSGGTTTRQLVEVDRSLINMKIWMNKSCGSPYYHNEKALIYFTTDVDGYITLYDIDTQGNVLVIFPNRHTPDNFVKAGQTLQLPAVEAGYDLIVEGPEGIEYIEGVASTNPYYRWDYRQGQPRWLKDWNIERRSKGQLQVDTMDQETMTAYKQSDEYQSLPQGLSASGLRSLQQNFKLSQGLREQVQTRLVVVPHAPDQPKTQPSQQSQTNTGGQAQTVSSAPMKDYSNASCFFYVVAAQPTGSAQPTSQMSNDYLGRQEQDFRRIQNLGIQRHDDRLVVEMPGSILFDSGSYMLRYQAQQALTKVADILLAYPQTDIVVLGHTDSKGGDDYNRILSESRSRSVAEYLTSRGVQQYRISWIGYGETMPIDTNTTDAGRQRNRRVELDIRMNPNYAQ